METLNPTTLQRERSQTETDTAHKGEDPSLREEMEARHDPLLSALIVLTRLYRRPMTASALTSGRPLVSALAVMGRR